MTYRSFQLFILFNLIISFSLKGQDATNATVHLLLLDENNLQPLETTIQWHSLKTNKDLFFKTDKSGKVNVIIQGNDSYELSINSSLAVFTVEIPKTLKYEKDLVLKFPIEKEETTPTVLHQPTVLQPIKDTVELVYQNLVGIQLLNKPSYKNLTIIDLDRHEKIWSSMVDTIRLVLPIKGHYKLVIDGVQIENDTFSMNAFSSKMIPFILYFNSNKSAKLYPIVDKTVMNLVQINLKDKPVIGDSILIIGKKSGLKYQKMTSENGSALFIISKNDSYEIHLKYFPKIATINVEQSMSKDLATFDYVIYYPSSVEVEKRKVEEEIRIAERDSLYKLYMKDKKLVENSLLIKLLNKEWESAVPKFSQDILINKDSIIKRLEQDPHYFEKIQNVICAVLYRFHKKWNDKVIVTDVTGSMSPYLKELVLWLTLDFMKEEKNTHLFFNDGDNKPDYSKVIGKTGGIYTTQSLNIDTIAKIMNKAINNGSGGDSPENNVEALLEGQKYTQSSTELILIADSYSGIKDIQLLSQLNKPIRIILCGANSLSGFHPDYLWLAYKTKGSIHTIEDDIMDLAAMVEGKIITIRGRAFKLLNNRFFEIR